MTHISTRMKTVALLCSVLLVVACSSKKAVVTVDETVKLAYLKEPDAQHTEAFSKHLGATLNKNRKRSEQEPGMMSDYAVTLVKLDRRAEANSWFNQEMEAFPASRPYILKLKSELLPEYVNDNTIRDFNDTSATSGEQPKQLSPAKRKAAEERAKNVVQSPELPEGTESETPVTQENENGEATSIPEDESTNETITPEATATEPQEAESETKTEPTE